MTAAERIAELEEEVAYLRGELGLMKTADDVAKLRRAFRLTPQEAHLVLALYGAHGRPLSHYQLLERIPSIWRGEHCSDNLTRVYVSKARKKLGIADYIATLWGHGFCLTPAGMDLIKAALAPEAVAA